MKTFHFKNEASILLFSFIILLQSCTLYQKVPTTTQEAVRSDNSILVESTYHQKLKFKKLTTEEGSLIGLAKKNSLAARSLQSEIMGPGPKKNWVRINIDGLEGKKFFLKDKTKSVVTTILLSTLLAGVPIALLVLSCSSCGDTASLDLGL